MLFNFSREAKDGGVDLSVENWELDVLSIESKFEKHGEHIVAVFSEEFLPR